MVWTIDRSGSPRLARSLVALVGEVDVRWPSRDRRSDGSIGDRAHSSRASDHNPDHQGVVRALDIDDNDVRPEERGIGQVIADHLIRTRDSRVKYMIYHGRICRSYRRPSSGAWQWTPYTGANAHEQHLHVSVVADSRADDVRPWGVSRLPATPSPPSAPPPRLEDTMTPAQEAKLDRALAAIDQMPQRVMWGSHEAVKIDRPRPDGTVAPGGFSLGRLVEAAAVHGGAVRALLEGGPRLTGALREALAEIGVTDLDEERIAAELLRQVVTRPTS